ncbi:ferritin-like domain-containing protein [Plastorhodobacter daqingensis]|uniref:Ferritin-like domain-containing protein n=1 Tax=Plastorhodobacter daqingensis TaxID=1387281 RepID=A0ABW2ULR7_9RHOB
MAINSLKDLYIDQLQDIHSANTQALDVTRALAEAAKNRDLRRALQAGVEGIGKGIEAVEKIVRAHDADPAGEHCKGMEGLVKEARAHALEEEFSDDDTRDAMIITQYQRMVHYAIAGYGCLVAFASRLDLSDDAAALQECLDHSYSGDRTMTDIATGGVNQAAV